MTLREIYQTCLAALEKLYSQQILFENILKDRKKYTKVCKKNYLKIKCKGMDYSCHYKPSAKKKNKIFINKKGKRKKVKFFKKKPYRGKHNKGCFIYGRKSNSSRRNLIEGKTARDILSMEK